MLSILTDDNNDIYLDATDSTGDAIHGSMLKMENGAEALRQVIVNRLRLQLGEYQYNTARGVDYTGLLLTDTPLVRLWEKQVLDIVNSIPEIKTINKWNYGLDGNVFKFELTVDTEYGIIEIKG